MDGTSRGYFIRGRSQLLSTRSLVSGLLTADLKGLYATPKFKSFLQQHARPRRAFTIKLELKCGCKAYFFYQFKTSPARSRTTENRIDVEYFVPTGSECHIDFLPDDYRGYPEYRLINLPWTHLDIHAELMRQKAGYRSQPTPGDSAIQVRN